MKIHTALRAGFMGCLALCLCALFATASGAAPAAKSAYDVRGAILLDMNSGRTLYAQNPDLVIAPASLTKVMTMFVVFDHIKAGKVNLQDKVYISRTAAGQGGSRMHLKAGEFVTVEKLLRGVAVSSGNDASVALAERVAGSQSAFVQLMNQKAKQLGLKKTFFANAHGLPNKKQRTCPRDMMLLSSKYLQTYPDAMRFHNEKVLVHHGVTTVNKNPLLNSFPGADGLKTGWVRASGYNLISTAKRDNTRLLAVVMGAKSPAVRAKESRRLMEAGFRAVRAGTKVAGSEAISFDTLLAGQPKEAIELH